MLTAAKINAAKRKERAYKLADALGLYLYVSPTGGKLWRFKYRFRGKEKLLSFGAYPEISLSDAREGRDLARKQVAKGIDPGETKRAEKASERRQDGFEVVAREWHLKFSPTWSSDYAATILGRLKLNIFPWIGGQPIGEIEPTDLLEVLRRMEDRGAIETAHKVKVVCGQVWRYAVATGRAGRDITVDLKGAIPPAEKKHHAALTEPKDVAGLLRAIDGFKGSFIVKCALRLSPLVFVRPGELRHSEWTEFDFDSDVWIIPGPKMKTKQDHIVPLSHQAKEILLSIKPLTGQGRYVFPSARTSLRAMSENTILAALRRMGYGKDEMTPHGFRAMARTILDEVLHFRPDIIEHQLAHAVLDPNGRAYNRTAHLEKRKEMMQTWSDYLDGLKAGAKILPFAKKAI